MEEVEDRKRRYVSIDADMASECEAAATRQGLTVGSWVRSLARRELARLAAEKPKKGKAK